MQRTNPPRPSPSGGRRQPAKRYARYFRKSVIIVPGYGLAVSQGQQKLYDFVKMLVAAGVSVKFATHPVAGRMPGQMDVLLAGAGVPYDMIFQLADINPDFATTDVALVVGANDVVNPAARAEKTSPIYGMPILEADKAKRVYVVKRGNGKGYAGIVNELFYSDTARWSMATRAAQGEWPEKPTPPFIPGHEAIGLIVEAGPRVTDLKVGDRVGVPWFSSACGHCEYCLSAWETVCPHAHFGGYTRNGGFAECVLADPDYVARILDGLGAKEAAPIICAVVTTYKGIKQTDAKPAERTAR